MKLSDAFPSNYLKADVDVPDGDEGSLTVVIKDVEMEEIGQGADKGDKPVVYFQGLAKGLVLNKTNGATISTLYGDDTDDWIGKPVALYSKDVEYQGKMTRGIRVKSKAPAMPKTAKTAAKAAAVEDGNEDIPF